MTALHYISIFLLTGYVGLIMYYWIGWSYIKTFTRKAHKNSTFHFTIIVPVRNEEKNILNCLHSLCHQQFDATRYEVLVVNDHSTDCTAELVQDFINHNKTHYVHLLNMTDDPAQRKLKKAAITYAVSQAKGDYIILTDGDCTRGENWLSTIDTYLHYTKHKMVYAPVAFTAQGLFEQFQALEFAGLVAIGGAAIQLKNPNMCSAANLIFEKKVFYEVDGYAGNEQLASGDDEFLLHKVFKRYPNQVSFLKNDAAIVYTTANSTLQQLAEQRKRWVSKSFHYSNRYITLILAGAYLFNLSIVVMLFIEPKLGLTMLFVKMLIELLFLQSVLRFFKKTKYLLLLPVAEVFHILYVLIIGLLGNFSSYTWKDRKHQ